MTLPRGVVAALIRVVVMTLLYIAYVAALSRSESTDALGAGLLFFLLSALVALGWAALDSSRSGLAASVGVWLVASALTGLTVSVAALVIDDSAIEVGGVVFLALLWFVPAVVGASAGALVHRSRGSAVV